jgi:hypothetical protein
VASGLAVVWTGGRSEGLAAAAARSGRWGHDEALCQYCSCCFTGRGGWRSIDAGSPAANAEEHVSAPKTKPTKVSAESHLAAIANEEQRDDARTLVALMRRVTRQEPVMWGPSIVGFGSYHYKYASGHEGDSALAAFAVRGSELVVYIAEGFEDRDALLAKLGKHRAGKVCVYIRRLANVDLKVLEALVARSIAETKRLYG